MYKSWTKYGLTFVYLVYKFKIEFVMAISFYIQSKKNPASIYIRIREGNIDAKTNTNLKINQANFSNGEIKYIKTPTGASAIIKRDIQERNNYLIELQNSLDNLKSKLTNLLNNRNREEQIDSRWLNEFVNPTSAAPLLPNQLSKYFSKFLEFKKSSLKPSTIKKLGSIKNRIDRYEESQGRVYIHNVDNKFSKSFQLWSDENGYDHNTKVKTLKVIKTVCNHASENGLPTSSQLGTITKGLNYKKSEHIHLNFDELKQINNTVLEDERLITAKDWLIISCFTAQRVSDFLRFTKNKVITLDGMNFLDISQEKTDEPVLIPLSQEVTTILAKRDGNFPPVFSENVESNKAIYNKLIKDVCELAGIKEVVSAKLKNKITKRYEITETSKYNAVSTHIGRRSFATNYYGKINSALLIAATGHASEQQFLRYVGKTGTQNALALAKEMRKLFIIENKEPQLTVVKHASNE